VLSAVPTKLIAAVLQGTLKLLPPDVVPDVVGAVLTVLPAAELVELAPAVLSAVPTKLIAAVLQGTLKLLPPDVVPDVVGAVVTVLPAIELVELAPAVLSAVPTKLIAAVLRVLPMRVAVLAGALELLEVTSESEDLLRVRAPCGLAT
jgi:hypothetical protein